MATGTQAVMTGKPVKRAAGAMCSAAVGTPLPTTVDEALDAALLAGGLGLWSSDGITETLEADVETVRAWGTDPVAQVQPEHNYSFTGALLETLNVVVLRKVYGDENVTVDAATGQITVNIVAGIAKEAAFVLEINDKNRGHVRIVIPNGQLVFSGEISYTDDGVASFPVTITALYNGDEPKAQKLILPVADRVTP